jgi:hypothetical protein
MARNVRWIPTVESSAEPRSERVGRPGHKVRARDMAADNPRPFRCGERWWPEDDRDAAALRGRGWYAVYVAAIIACAALLLLRAPPPCTATLAEATTSDVVAPWALLLFRGAACALVVGTLVSLGRQELTVTLEAVDRSDVGVGLGVGVTSSVNLTRTSPR